MIKGWEKLRYSSHRLSTTFSRSPEGWVMDLTVCPIVPTGRTDYYRVQVPWYSFRGMVKATCQRRSYEVNRVIFKDSRVELVYLGEMCALNVRLSSRPEADTWRQLIRTTDLQRMAECLVQVF